jgi:hypothetical protein
MCISYLMEAHVIYAFVISGTIIELLMFSVQPALGE